MLLIMLMLCFKVFVASSEPPLVTFSQLGDFDKNKSELSTIRIRGFLYETKNENHPFILSNEPNVKSCCVPTLLQQIKIFGEIDPQYIKMQALLLEGSLKVEQSMNNNPSFLLLNAHIIEEEKMHKSIFIGGVLLLLLTALTLLLKRIKNIGCVISEK